MARTEVKSTQIKHLTILVDDLRDFGPEDGGGLNLNLKAGRIRDDNTVTDTAAQVVALTDNTTNFVELSTVGVASANTTAFTAGSIPVAQVVTSGAAISTITDKRAWVAGGGGGTSAVEVNVHVRDTVGASIANNTRVVHTYDTEEYDTDGMHDGSGAPGRLTVQTAGKYFIWARTRWPGDKTGFQAMFLLKNGGGPDIGSLIRNSTTGGSTFMQVIAHADLAVNDFIEFSVEQTSGGAIDSGGASLTPAFGMFRTGP